MKVLLVTQRFPPAIGGVENHVFHLARGLLESEDEVEVFSTDLRKDVPFERLDRETSNFPFPVRRFRATRAAILPHALGIVAPGMMRRILSGCWDVVHGHAYGYFPTFAAALGSVLDRAALVITPHSDPGRSTLAKLVFDSLVPLATLRLAERVIALTGRESSYLATLGVPRERIAIVPNGVDMAEFARPVTDPVNSDGRSVLFAGRCYPDQKGLRTLVEALALLSPRLPIRLRVVGEDWGGHQVVKDLSRKLGVQNQVTLVGPLDRTELVAEFHRADLFVLPSHFDSFPLTILEAMAAGLPIIATRVGGVPEIVDDGHTGLLVAPRDVRALSEALERLSSDASLRYQLGLQGKAKARSFSWQDTVSKTRRVYEEAIAARGA